MVSSARPEVGAVASQSIVEPAYGRRLLDRLEAGESPEEALSALLGEDDSARFRQVAVIDSSGALAVHTGAGCIAHAGDVSGNGFSAQANMMATPEVWPAMAAAFEESDGPLAGRLLAALLAGEGAGGDLRGRQSAALLVVPPASQPWWRTVDLRVEDDPDPLAELQRLLVLHEAYALASEADELVGEGRHARGRRPLPAGRGAGPRKRRACLLVRAGARPGGRPRGGTRAGAAGNRGPSGLEGAAAAARSRGRAGRGGRARGAGDQPLTWTTTVRSRARSSKSSRTSCCQVPSASRPSRTGTVSDGPITEARWCACEFESWLRRLCS